MICFVRFRELREEIKMAMNKKEKKLVEELQVIAALRWTDNVKKDMPIPDSLDLVAGYTFNEYSAEVRASCSTSISHNTHSPTRTTSQNGIEMYSTKGKALRALRHALCIKVAKELRAVDKLIEASDKEI
ncbi:hypothetical protein MNBD_GAMMA01-1312 [hydrothermal vent metagenome]|uniref:Uncharacterized protein n=1 Tax=hydrothermal vent metagenome TaxID=652676 RepID=A0A3B0VPV5_9ZZZZ